MTPQAVNDTHYTNSVGFNHADAHGLSIKAKYFLKHQTLLGWQVEKCRKQLPKYWRQLWEIGQANKAA